MAHKRAFAIIFHPQTPPQLFQLFEGYIEEHNSLKMVFCDSPSFDASFVSARISKLDMSKTWEVQIPLGCVLSIVEAGSDQPAIGFVSQTRS